MANAAVPRPPFSMLVVDKNASQRRRLSGLAKHQFGEGVIVYEAEDGAAALQHAKRYRVDVALIDQRLPDMDGLQVLEELDKRKDGTAGILLTGQGQERSTAEALQHGTRDCLSKDDLSGPSLERAVNHALHSATLEKQNARMQDQLRRTNAQMDHFVRALSHDMGVNFILLESSFRQLKQSWGETPLPAALEATAHVEACLKESQRFLADLTQLGKTGSVHMEPQRVELDQTIAEVLFEQQPTLADRNIQTIVHAPLPAVWCHPSRVRQVFTNLIRNAAKHGCDPADPRITIAQEPAPESREDSSRVRIRIHDNGPGIPRRYREEIFLPGRRVPGTTTSGSGMGLAIVRRIVEHYQGTINIDSACKLGTSFVFSLPAAC